MTDDESFGDIVASFPFGLNDLRLLYQRSNNLMHKAAGAKYSDGTLDGKSWRQLQNLTHALRSLMAAAEDIEHDRDPGEDDIPF